MHTRITINLFKSGTRSTPSLIGICNSTILASPIRIPPNTWSQFFSAHGHWQAHAHMCSKHHHSHQHFPSSIRPCSSPKSQHGKLPATPTSCRYQWAAPPTLLMLPPLVVSPVVQCMPTWSLRCASACYCLSWALKLPWLLLPGITATYWASVTGACHPCSTDSSSLQLPQSCL